MKLYNKGARAYRRVFKDKKGQWKHHLSGKTLEYPNDVGKRMLERFSRDLERVDGGETKRAAKPKEEPKEEQAEE